MLLSTPRNDANNTQLGNVDKYTYMFTLPTYIYLYFEYYYYYYNYYKQTNDASPPMILIMMHAHI